MYLEPCFSSSWYSIVWKVFSWKYLLSVCYINCERVSSVFLFDTWECVRNLMSAWDAWIFFTCVRLIPNAWVSLAMLESWQVCLCNFKYKPCSFIKMLYRKPFHSFVRFTKQPSTYVWKVFWIPSSCEC